MRACVTCGVAGLRVDRAVRPPPCACASSQPAAPDCLARHLLAHTCTCMRPLNCEPCAACGPPRCYPLPPPAALADHKLLCSLRHIITQSDSTYHLITTILFHAVTSAPDTQSRNHVFSQHAITPSCFGTQSRNQSLRLRRHLRLLPHHPPPPPPSSPSPPNVCHPNHRRIQTPC